MQNQPDHDQPRFGDFGSDTPAERVPFERLSIMALMSTITGALTFVGCCVPGVGLVPLLLAVGGVFFISRSRGALRGKGLAILGGALGALSLLISTVLWIGVSSAAGKIGPVYSQAFDPDPAVVRTVLTSNAAAELTDEQVAAFQEALAAEGITTVSIPTGLVGLFSGFNSVDQDPVGFDKLRSPTEGVVYPFPAETDSGWVYTVVLMDPTQKLGSGLFGLADAGLWTADGDVIWLIGPDAANPGQSPDPDQTDTGPDGDGTEGQTPAPDPEG